MVGWLFAQLDPQTYSFRVSLVVSMQEALWWRSNLQYIVHIIYNNIFHVRGQYQPHIYADPKKETVLGSCSESDILKKSFH